MNIIHVHGLYEIVCILIALELSGHRLECPHGKWMRSHASNTRRGFDALTFSFFNRH